VQVVDLPLKDIRPYWRNPRKNDGAVDAVRRSIETYGYNQPIVVDAENVIIAGHTRYKALQQLGVDTASCVVLDLDPAKAKEYRIADNKTNELSSWDYENLIPELREVGNLEDLQIYFQDDDLDRLVRDVSPTYEAPPAQEHIEERGRQMDQRFERDNAEELASYVTLVCPECAEEFAVNRDEFLARLELPEESRT